MTGGGGISDGLHHDSLLAQSNNDRREVAVLSEKKVKCWRRLRAVFRAKGKCADCHAGGRRQIGPEARHCPAPNAF